tara:strand:+ start:1087 stop:1359 length:273 start_codon:yes stop_codon:yes gene_type:complete
MYHNLMKKLFEKNIILQKIFYWISAIFFLIAVPTITITILRLGTIFYPLGLIIKICIYIFCGGVTFVGFIAIFLFFYESIISKIRKKRKD